MASVTLIHFRNGEMSKTKKLTTDLSIVERNKMKTLKRCWWHHRSLPKQDETSFVGYYDDEKCCWDNCYALSESSRMLDEKLKQNGEKAVQSAIISINRSKDVVCSYFLINQEIKNIDKKIKVKMVRLNKVVRWNDRNAKQREGDKVKKEILELKIKLKKIKENQNPDVIVEKVHSTIKMEKGENEKINESLDEFNKQLKRFINAITPVEYQKLLTEIEKPKINVIEWKKPKKMIDENGDLISAFSSLSI
jgi:hypothetical protein